MKRKKETRFWETEKFKRLQKTWDKKLADSDFKDVERDKDGFRELKSSLKEFHNADLRWEYFDQLEKKVREDVFDNEVDRIVLTKRANGERYREIQVELKKIGWPQRPGSKFVSRDTIRAIVRKYEDKWGIRSWKKNTQ